MTVPSFINPKYIRLKIRQVRAARMIIPEHTIQSIPVSLIREEVDLVVLCTFTPEYNS
jgi:hypothetical protein